MEQYITYPKFRAKDTDDTPLSGGKLYTYSTGTNSPKTTYSDYAKTTPNSNPIILDSNGECMLVLGEGGYRLTLTDSDDVQLWSIDNIYGTLGPIVTTIYANEGAVIGDQGDIDGEIAIDASQGNVYTWDNGNSKWRVRSNNIYGTDPSTTSFTVETGTVIWNTAQEKQRTYDGSAWSNTVPEGFTASSLSGAIFARPKFSWKDTDEIYIDPFVMHHSGTTEQIVSCTSQLTFQFGPSGSNSNSDSLANNDWFYLYIDDSEVSSATIAADDLIALTEEPVWNNSKHCWVGTTDSNDKLIGMFRTNASGEIIEFFQNDRKINFVDHISESTSVPTTSWGTYTVTAPSCCTMIEAYIYHISTTGADLYTRPTGATGTGGREISRSSLDGIHALPLSSSQQVDLKVDAGTVTSFKFQNNGFYLPIGV
jgi:hypothetical protein